MIVSLRPTRRVLHACDRRGRALGRIARAAALLGLAALASVLVPLRAARAEAVDVLGTWYVLVHYKDTSTANPDADRWLDLVWVLSMKGSRLEWKEYPIVVFEDATGRFEAIPGNPKARALRAWEPNASQLAALAAGPRVNDRGARTKTLRGSAERGWTSPDRRSGGAGLNVMGYQEVLSIERPTTLPRFVRADVLGNEYAQGDSGQVVYETLEVRDGGDTLVGRYQRDDHRSGVFRAWRTPAPRGLPEKEGTPNDRLTEQMKASGGLGGTWLRESSDGPPEGVDEDDDL